MRLLATRIGRTVPAEFRGTVRAVWTKAFAVAIDSDTGAEEPVALVTFVRQDVPMTAASVALLLPADHDFGTAGPAVGGRVTSDGSVIVLRAGDARGEQWQIDLRDAGQYDGGAPETPTCIAPELVGSLVDAARRHRTAMCGRELLGQAAADACDDRLGRLSLCTIAHDARGAEKAARSLVGLGPGLTPSGDDALCGFLLGRAISGFSAELVDAAIRSVASDAYGRTSDVSAVQLDLAAQGRFGEALLDVATALGSPDPSLVRSAVSYCLAQGASSGADGLLGLAAGLRAGAESGGSRHAHTRRCERRKMPSWL